MEDDLGIIKPVMRDGKRAVRLQIDGVFSPAEARAFGFKVQTVAEQQQVQDIADDLHERAAEARKNAREAGRG